LTSTRSTNGETSLLAISDVLDIEEDILSPNYGLKGKLDVSVETVVENNQPPFFSKRQDKSARSSTGPMPFEIKTGRAVAGLEHRAQTMLYTLLMSERYGVQINEGLLYYTQSDEVVRVPAARNEIRSLMVVRNELASYMMKRTKKHGKLTGTQPEIEEPFLPPTIDDERTCGRCYTLDTCMLYRKVCRCIHINIANVYFLYPRLLITSRTTHLRSRRFTTGKLLTLHHPRPSSSRSGKH
jgi:DNA replication ATP-dependent helicase Dna2